MGWTCLFRIWELWVLPFLTRYVSNVVILAHFGFAKSWDSSSLCGILVEIGSSIGKRFDIQIVVGFGIPIRIWYPIWIWTRIPVDLRLWFLCVLWLESIGTQKCHDNKKWLILDKITRKKTEQTNGIHSTSYLRLMGQTGPINLIRPNRPTVGPITSQHHHQVRLTQQWAMSESDWRSDSSKKLQAKH